MGVGIPSFSNINFDIGSLTPEQIEQLTPEQRTALGIDEDVSDPAGPQSFVWNIPENYLLEIFDWLSVPGNTENLQAAGEDGALWVYNILSQNGFINPDEMPFEYFSENIYPTISSQGAAGLQSLLNQAGAVNVTGSTGVAAPDLSGATAQQLQENEDDEEDDEEDDKPLTRNELRDFIQNAVPSVLGGGGVGGGTPLTGGGGGGVSGGLGGYYGGPGFQAPMVGGNIGGSPYVAPSQAAGPGFSSPMFSPDIDGGEADATNDPNGYLAWLERWINENFPDLVNDPDPNSEETPAALWTLTQEQYDELARHIAANPDIWLSDTDGSEFYDQLIYTNFLSPNVTREQFMEEIWPEFYASGFDLESLTGNGQLGVVAESPWIPLYEQNGQEWPGVISLPDAPVVDDPVVNDPVVNDPVVDGDPSLRGYPAAYEQFFDSEYFASKFNGQSWINPPPGDTTTQWVDPLDPTVTQTGHNPERDILGYQTYLGGFSWQELEVEWETRDGERATGRPAPRTWNSDRFTDDLNSASTILETYPHLNYNSNWFMDPRWSDLSPEEAQFIWNTVSPINPNGNPPPWHPNHNSELDMFGLPFDHPSSVGVSWSDWLASNNLMSNGMPIRQNRWEGYTNKFTYRSTETPDLDTVQSSRSVTNDPTAQAQNKTFNYDQRVSNAMDQARQQLEEFTPDIGTPPPPGEMETPADAAAVAQSGYQQPASAPTSMPATSMPQQQDPKKGTPSPQAMGQAAQQAFPQQRQTGTAMSGGLGQPSMQQPTGRPTGRGAFSSQ